jgi:cellulase/cellobiase CelA1
VQSVTWATGIADDAHLTCAAEAAASAVGPGELPLTGPLAAVVAMPHFRARVGASSEGDTPATGTRSIPSDLPEDTGTWGEPEDNADLVLVVNSDWGSGYCVDATVTNSGSAAVTWSVHTASDGTIGSLWNANLAEDGTDWVFTGVDWNATLEPGASTSFGYCANR